MNKKGSLEDTATILVLLFSGAILLFMAFFAFGTLTDTFMTTAQTNDSAVMPVWQATKDLTARFDYIILAVFIASTLTMLVTAYIVGGNPIFTVFYFIGVVIIVIVSSLISNAWVTFSTRPPISAYALSSFVITNHLLVYAPIYISVIGVFGILLTFVRAHSERR